MRTLFMLQVDKALAPELEAEPGEMKNLQMTDTIHRNLRML